eukprot:15450846-Alexandrium_andersonii.AAC.1
MSASVGAAFDSLPSTPAPPLLPQDGTLLVEARAHDISTQAVLHGRVDDVLVEGRISAGQMRLPYAHDQHTLNTRRLRVDDTLVEGT